MTAKEMFKKLGYELINENEVVMQYYNIEYDYEICIDKEFKTIEPPCVPYFFITIDLLKAINKQVEELGWKEVEDE